MSLSNSYICRMRSLFRWKPKTPRTRRKERIYAIGDVHGRHDLLCELLEHISDHLQHSKHTAEKVHIVFLGDLIDRGPDSMACLDTVEKLFATPGVVCLRGNHEDLMLRSMDGDATAQQIWMANGGEATLASFGIDAPSEYEDAFDFAERLSSAVPERIVRMLKSTGTHFVNGDYFFVHAGVRPGVALTKQDESDLIFIRDEFTGSSDWHGAVIVHGHSIVDEVDMRENRIAVDTGAYRSGVLSCLCIQDGEREVIATGNRPLSGGDQLFNV